MATRVNQTISIENTSLETEFGVVAVKKTITLDAGKVIEPFSIAYSLYGDKSLPLVVVLGGITASRFVVNPEYLEARSLPNNHPDKGWWDELVGYEKAVDTNKYCVLSFDYISTLTLDNKVGQSFIYSLTPADQAIVLKTLLDSLELFNPISVIGSSYGGMVGLSFAELFPKSIKSLTCVSASDRSTHTARAIRAIQKGIFDLADEPDKKHQALSLARQLSILFYRTDDIFDQQFVDPIAQSPSGKFIDHDKTIYSYLHHQGQKFANKSTISAYSALLDSIDKHSVSAEKIYCDTYFVGVPNDRLVSYESMRSLAHKVNGTSKFYRLESIYGHDAFLKEFKQLSELFKKILGESDESSTINASC